MIKPARVRRMRLTSVCLQTYVLLCLQAMHFQHGLQGCSVCFADFYAPCSFLLALCSEQMHAHGGYGSIASCDRVGAVCCLR